MCRAESDGIVVQEAVKYDVNNTYSDAFSQCPTFSSNDQYSFPRSFLI